MSALTREQKTAIVERLVDTSGTGDGAVMEEFDLEVDELEEIMLAGNVERCPDCGWWCDSGDMVDEAGDPAPCSDCRKDGGE